MSPKYQLEGYEIFFTALQNSVKKRVEFDSDRSLRCKNNSSPWSELSTIKDIQFLHEK